MAKEITLAKKWKNTFVLKDGNHAEPYRNARYGLNKWTTGRRLDLHMGNLDLENNGTKVGSNKLKDFAGSNHGQIAGYSVSWCPKLDGNDDWFSIPASSLLDKMWQPGAWSIGVSIRPPYHQVTEPILSQVSLNEVYGWKLQLQQGNLDDISAKLRFRVWTAIDPGPQGSWRTTDRPISMRGEWSRIWVVFDGTAIGNEPTIWINGTEYTVGSGLTEENNYPLTEPPDMAGVAFVIGAEETNPDYFTGFLCNVMVADFGLTAQQIADDLEGTLDTSGFECHYKMDEEPPTPFANSILGKTGDLTEFGVPSRVKIGDPESSTTAQVIGRHGSKCTNFDPDEYVFVLIESAPNLSFPPNGAFSIIVSCLFSDFDDVPILMKGVSPLTREWEFSVSPDPNNYLRLRMYQDQDPSIYIGRRTNAGVLNLSTWYTLGITTDGTTTTSNWTIYINGSPVATADDSAGAFTGMVAYDDAFHIGANWEFTGKFFNGNIGRVLVYGSQLSAAKMLQLHEQCAYNSYVNTGGEVS